MIIMIIINYDNRYIQCKYIYHIFNVAVVTTVKNMNIYVIYNISYAKKTFFHAKLYIL